MNDDRGTPGGLLFLDFNEPAEKVCVTNLDQDKPDVTFVIFSCR